MILFHLIFLAMLVHNLSDLKPSVVQIMIYVRQSNFKKAKKART